MTTDRFGFRRTDARQKTRIVAEIPAASTDGSVATIRLYEPIDSWGEFWGVSAKEFTAVLDELPDHITEIRLHVNSPGGECWEAVAILNSLRNHPARVVVTVDGIAASAASIVTMGGDEVIMARNAEMMVHNARGLCYGDATDMRDVAEQLERINRNMASVYADRAGGTVEEWLDIMAEETWYSDAEAVAAGLADRVIPKDPKDAAAAKASFDLSMFNHAGRASATGPQTPAPPQASGQHDPPPTQERGFAVDFTDDQLSNLRQRLGIEDTADEAAILAALDTAPPEPEVPVAPAALPDGVVTIDETVLADLRADATAGRAARAQQEQEGRERLVVGAVNDGRIRPASREAWLNKLSTDPDGPAALASLEPGLVPVSPVGYVGAGDTPDESTAEGVRASTAYKNWSR